MKKTIAGNKLPHYSPTKYSVFLPVLYYSLLGTLLLSLWLAPELNSCRGTGSWFCLGPATSAIMFLTFPGNIFILATGILDLADASSMLLQILLASVAFIIASAPTALVITLLGRMLDHGQIKKILLFFLPLFILFLITAVLYQ